MVSPYYFISVEHSVSVSTITSNLEQLSVQQDQGAAPEEDNSSVIIPSHLQVQSADCSHLSFGSFRCGISSFSGPFPAGPSQSNIDEVSADADAPSVVHLDTRYTLLLLLVVPVL